MNQTESKPPVQTPEDESIVYRDQKRRYPWWVKSVEAITTETDDSRLEAPDGSGPAASGNGQTRTRKEPSFEEITAYTVEGIRENIPGRTLPDLALHYSAATYMHYTVGSLGDPRFNPLPGIGEIQNTWKLHPPQSLGLPAWEVSPVEAADVVEAAGIQLGAAMVGMTTMNPKWLNAGVVVDADAEQITNDGMNTLVPERMKYVICLIGVNPSDLVNRSFTELGAAGDRAGYEMTFMAYTRMMRFIKGLGYDAFDLQMIAPIIPFAIAAGLGELGRMNRLVNPIFGGNVRLGAVLTDLPLAIDKPIDFGLQKFCEKCKKCAISCPANAISQADEPYWETVDPRQVPGKKVYFENNRACVGWQSNKDLYCSGCMSACSWSKQDRTSLHQFARIAASKAPSLGKLLVGLDDFFGYGHIADGKEISRWWELNRPTRGIYSDQGRRF